MTRSRILVVDDDLDHAESLAVILEMEGHMVTIAGSGEEALEKFSAGEFDLSFLDLKLPGMNGVEVLAEMRRRRPGSRAVLMTGYRVEQLIAQAIDEGALRVLRKPFEIEEVLTLVREIEPRGIVLVADDDPDFAASAEQLLSDAGYRVLVANTGSQAIERATSEPVDVLVLDLRLPVLDGLDVYLELKRRGRELPTVLVTAYRTEEADSIDVLRSMSVTGCLFKPFEPTELLNAVDSIRTGKYR